MAERPCLHLGGLTIGSAVLLCGSLAGCPPPRIQLRDARQALAHVNGNLRRIDGALYCGPALVSFRFRDARGRERRFIGQPATVIFQAPRCLYFDIKHALGGSVAHIGSNDERFWLWVATPDFRKLWWGRWDDLEPQRPGGWPVPPGRLLDALLLRPLPENVPGGLRALLLDEHPYRLLFQRLADDGWPYVAREVVLDARPPYQPVEIIDRLPDGRVAMHAAIRHYRPVEGTGPSGPWTARRYVVRWPLNEAEMRLDISRARYRTKDTPFCEFPADWPGPLERIGRPAAADSATPESN